MSRSKMSRDEELCRATELKQAQEILRAANEQTEGILASITDAFLSLDDALKVTYFNRAAEEMLHRRAADVLGRHLFDAFPEGRDSIFQEKYEQGVREKQALSFEAYFGIPPYENWYSVRIYPQEHGISVYFRVTTEEKRLGQATKFLATCGAREPGVDFFRSLAQFLGRHLRMDYVCIDRLEEGNLSARTVAVYFDGEFEDNVSYTLKDTPCGDVVEKTVCSFPTGVRHRFPRDQVLQDMGAESYFGTTLFSHEGKPIGLIALIGRRPEASPKLVEAILELAAIRAGAELERAAAEEALGRARDAAQAADRAKSAFLANMSHEIRTPMSAVVGMLGLLRATPLDSSQRRYAELAVSSGTQLLHLIDDILDFSKIEAGKLELESVDLSPRLVVEEAVHAMAVLAKEKGVGLSSRFEPDVPELLSGDPHRLRQVLLNLIGNALKFTEEGEVKVTVGLDQTRPTCPTGLTSLQFTVRDTGIGIPAARMDRLFQSFSQVDDSTARAFGGTGLGLAISKQLVERMGGSIWVRSEEGRGSVFAFSVPFAVASAKPQGTRVTPTALGVEGSPVLERLRILLAEDEPVNSEVVATYLRQRGWQVTAVGDGKAAVDALRIQPFDVVLMDVQMPGVDGFEATRLIREWERPGGTRVPIVGLTAHALKGDREKCLEAGMDDYFAKPVQREQLYSTVERWARLSRSLWPAEGTPEGTTVSSLLAAIGPDRAAAMRSIFRESMRDGLDNLSRALSEENADQVSFWAHRLRGSLVVFGFADAAGVACEIETAACVDATLVARLEKEIERAVGAF